MLDSESEMQAFIKQCNMPQIQTKSDANKNIM